jgi:hypothetical protein
MYSCEDSVILKQMEIPDLTKQIDAMYRVHENCEIRRT